ncbi:MAG: deoxyribodipyrimidine photolyase [Halobacteriovorax sp.]|nr:deoxyribodipyrimidine photolyase [Halobacteriovorax sp.]
MQKGLVWFRRDLRLHDHAALASAISSCDEVHCLFVFDPEILSKLEDKNDARVQFIHDSLVEMQNQASIEVRYGDPKKEILAYCQEHEISDVFTNRDYEPMAKERDQAVKEALSSKNIKFHTFMDSVVYEAKRTLKDDGTPYKVFTPYMKRWLSVLAEDGFEVANYQCDLSKIVKTKNSINSKDWMKEVGFHSCKPHLEAGTQAAKKQLEAFKKKISDYTIMRDFPAADGTSMMSVYIRHGNISVRDLVRAAQSGSTEGHHKWLSEVIWREFYQYILDQFPQVEKQAFRPAYDQIKWRGGKKELEAWKNGETGFPIIDAAMRCLKATGTMPNRLRMVTASFLCKTLLVNWREGEKWFAAKLLDFDLAANNGGWQWCASSGVDAQPYFRIFNPYSQSKKFDPDGIFIKTWCPELSNLDEKSIHAPHELLPMEQQLAGCVIGQEYPAPVVDYAKKRVEALAMYKQALG